MIEEEIKFDEQTYVLLLNALNRKELTKKDTGLTSRVINNWDEEELIDDEREIKTTWRKFSVVDILWISTIGDLKEFGAGTNIIRKVKQHLFSKLPGRFGETRLERHIIQVISMAKPTFIVVDSTGDTEVLTGTQYLEKLQENRIGNHLVISLNKGVSENFEELHLSPFFEGLQKLSGKEKELLDIIRKNTFSSIHIRLRNGEMEMIEGREQIDIEKRIIDLLREQQYQNIEVKQQNGKVVSIERVVKRKLQG
ncbi:hypothetical protein GCM10009122_22580 [Fulvivirga kasyanovii]|uniref:MerR family transcriptional regulator n=1 Tax=Fulvivirga kasyanovii TaxID=396812 RepID=A0ABW9RP23_9BACT|nr:MerR family transcriptional regulator [Fulvivirga kasyanovii]MTI25756.1 MerR family transcriptional regulator [Fulvivirga kasyanovii]